MQTCAAGHSCGWRCRLVLPATLREWRPRTTGWCDRGGPPPELSTPLVLPGHSCERQLQTCGFTRLWVPFGYRHGRLERGPSSVSLTVSGDRSHPWWCDADLCCRPLFVRGETTLREWRPIAPLGGAMQTCAAGHSFPPGGAMQTCAAGHSFPPESSRAMPEPQRGSGRSTRSAREGRPGGFPARTDPRRRARRKRGDREGFPAR